MTENEKAATFIGWINDARMGLSATAPDMSRPENYMQVLGALYREEGRVNREALLAAVSRALFNANAGEIVSYLAALYDKEHSA